MVLLCFPCMCTCPPTQQQVQGPTLADVWTSHARGLEGFPPFLCSPPKLVEMGCAARPAPARTRCRSRSGTTAAESAPGRGACTGRPRRRTPRPGPRSPQSTSGPPAHSAHSVRSVSCPPHATFSAKIRGAHHGPFCPIELGLELCSNAPDSPHCVAGHQLAARLLHGPYLHGPHWVSAKGNCLPAGTQLGDVQS